MEKETTSVSMRKDIKERANGALAHGFFSGVGSLSGLIDKALEELMDRNKVPKTLEQAKKD